MSRLPRPSLWVALVAVAATYFHFLIFTEFALLELAGGLKALPVMGGLAAGGLAGSAAAAWRVWRGRGGLGLLAALLGAASILACSAPAWAAGAVAPLAAFAEGLSLGGATVTLALCLLPLAPRGRLGVVIGLGTGLAYAAANVPAVFESQPSTQALLGGLVSALGALVCWAGRFLGLDCARGAAAARADGGPETSVAGGAASSFASPRASGLSGPGLLSALLVLLLLVWVDSAVFYVIQHTPALRENTWVGVPALWGNATVHLVFAVVSGLLLDAGRGRLPLALAWLLLCAGALLSRGQGGPAAYSGFTYASGVSFYSVVLVWEAARRSSPWHAASLFGIAGWMGSGLGIGMVQELQAIPLLFLAISGVCVLGLLASTRRGSSLWVLSPLLLLFPPDSLSAAEDQGLVRGREVYQAEGCIQCHSQYVRAGVGQDELLYGPARPVEEQVAGAPPLVGNRRLGPDLSNLANRRSRAWNRLHLLDPRSLVPGSPMPSYARLFEGDAEPGEALLDYLASLGAQTLDQRRRQIDAWQPSAVPVLVSRASARSSWLALCAACHGAQGGGDGPLAPSLDLRPPNFAQGEWRRLPPPAGDARHRTQLMRAIKFGFPGSSMPGHEWLDDETLANLASEVDRLHGLPVEDTP